MTILSITDHLSIPDKDLLFDKIARCVADDLRQERVQMTIYKGQQAVADRLSCSVDTVHKLMAEQRLGYTRVGTKGYSFTESQVLAYQAAA